MGQALLKPTSEPIVLQEATRMFVLWTIDDVKEFYQNHFRKQIHGYSITKLQFEVILSFAIKKQNFHIDLKQVFEALDHDHDGRIDGLEFLSGLTLCSQSSLEEKASFWFEIFDFNFNLTLSRKEITIMLVSILRGYKLLIGIDTFADPEILDVEQLAEQAFLEADTNNNNMLSYDEFVKWVRSNRSLIAVVDQLQKPIYLSKSLLLSVTEKDEEDNDSALSVESDDRDIVKDDSNLLTTGTYDNMQPISLPLGDENQAVVQWKSQIHNPSSYAPDKYDREGPKSHLELEWAFGFSCMSTKNNVRYVKSTANIPECDAIVYPVGAVIVRYNIKEKSQSFYQGHSNQISCLTAHENYKLVASGDMKSFIHIWDTITLSSCHVFQCALRNGIQHIRFSPSGNRIAVTGCDPDHTFYLFDMTTRQLIASAKGIGSPNVVNDLAFSPSGSELTVVGKGQVKYYKGLDTVNKSIPTSLGKIGQIGTKQMFHSAVYIGNEVVVVGCSSGELYRFQNGTCVQKLQCHGVDESILCMHYSIKDGILFTGGSDIFVKLWDCNLNPVGVVLDISKSASISASSNLLGRSKVISIQNCHDMLLIGLNGCDIFEVSIPQKSNQPQLFFTQITSGHSLGEVTAVAAHPMRSEFITCGSDKTLRFWNILDSNRNLAKMRVFKEFFGTAVSYSPHGEVVATGMSNGTVELIDAESDDLTSPSSWKHTSKAVTDLKFSPNGMYLAVGSKDTNIYVYANVNSDNLNKFSNRTFIRYCLLKGHSGSITHIDFSSDSQFIQSNGAEGALLFWSVKDSKQIKSSVTMRDIPFDVSTTVFGWGKQGIWPQYSDFTDVNCCMALTDIGVTITGDDNKKLNLYRYPSVTSEPLHNTYTGHGSHVTGVCFTASRRQVISIGGIDKTVLIWKHDMELADEHEHENNIDDMHIKADSTKTIHSETKPVSTENFDNPKLGYRGESKPDLSGFNAFESGPQSGDEFMAVKPWKSSVVEPTVWKSDVTTRVTDCDLKLEWVHGANRNKALYSANGSIVYTAATVAIVYSKKTNEQKFLHGAHSREIISIASQNSGEIFATGDRGAIPSIIVWNSINQSVLQRLDKGHNRGVSLLSFDNSGNYLASIGQDDNNTLIIYDWSHGMEVVRTSTDKSKVLCMCFLYQEKLPAGLTNSNYDSSPVEVIVTGGDKHLKFWTYQGKNIKSQRALWGKEGTSTINCVTSGTPNVCITGNTEGELLVWKDYKIVSNVKVGFKERKQIVGVSSTGENVEYPHKSSIQSLCAIPTDLSSIMDSQHSSNVHVRYLSGDKNGIVALWQFAQLSEPSESLTLVLISIIDVLNLTPKPLKASIQSLNVRLSECHTDTTGMVLISTAGCEIYEVSLNSFSTKNPATLGSTSGEKNVKQVIAADRITTGHYQGELWGLAIHPSQPIVFTAGDDQTLRCWNITDHTLASFMKFEDKCRAVDIQPSSGRDIAVGLHNGHVVIVKTSLFMVPNENRGLQISPEKTSLESGASSYNGENTQILVCSKRQIQELKFSFNDEILAVGSHDTHIYLYKVPSNGKAYELLKTCKGHSSYITHLDFGVILHQIDDEVETFNSKLNIITTINSSTKTVISDRPLQIKDICLQSTCGAYELLFWHGDGSRITAPHTIKDNWWASWTCTLGWPVQGIWEPGMDGTDINSVCRSHTWNQVPVLATGDDYYRVKLFSYPCIEPGSISKSYLGHSSHVTCVRFTCDDSYCLSIGGRDNCLLVWKTDILEEIREKQAGNLPVQPSIVVKQAEILSISGSASPSTSTTSAAREIENVITNSTNNLSMRPLLKKRQIAVNLNNSKTTFNNVTKYFDANLDLQFVYGYRAWDVRGNLGYVASTSPSTDCFAYHVASVGVVYNTRTHSQIHHRSHQNEIISLTSHCDRRLVATGELGFQADIHIWDSSTGVSIQTLRFHSQGVSHIAFTQCGQMLISAGMDSKHRIAVHDVFKGTLIGTSSLGGNFDLLALAIGGNETFITGGNDHLTIWRIPSQTSGHSLNELSSKSGIFHASVTNRSICAITFLKSPAGYDTITGMSDGSVLLWRNRINIKVCFQGHTGAVTAVKGITEPKSFSSAAATSNSSNSSSNANITSHNNRFISGGIDGMIFMWSNQLVKIWTLDMKLSTPKSLLPSIQAIDYNDGKILVGTKAAEIYETNLTTGETFRYVQGHFEIESVSTSSRSNYDYSGIAAHPNPSSQRFATVSKDMTARLWCGQLHDIICTTALNVALTCVCFSFDGASVYVGCIDGSVRVLSGDDLRVVSSFSIAMKSLTVIKASPDGSIAAVGCADNNVYIVDSKSFNLKFLLKGHTNLVADIDFSTSMKYVKSCSSSGEIVTWDLSNKGVRVHNSDFEGVKWNHNGVNVKTDLTNKLTLNTNCETEGCIICSTAFNAVGSTLFSFTADGTAILQFTLPR